jgi:hypothetical protein
MDWTEILVQVLELVVIPLIGTGVAYLIAWLKSKTKNDTLKKYVDMLDDTIMNCVLATKQTYVDALKKEGAFDEAAKQKAFQLTYDAVVAVLTDEAQKYLGESIKDLKVYITNKIEASVGMTK